jgi:choline dehydrogenase
MPTVVKHGIGAAKNTGEEVKSLGVTKVLIVTDPGVQKAGLISPIMDSLEEAGLSLLCRPEIRWHSLSFICNDRWRWFDNPLFKEW